MSERGFRVRQLFGRMSVAVEGKHATRSKSFTCQGIVHILARRIAVDLDRDTSLSPSRKDCISIGDDAAGGSCDSASGMGQDPNSGVLDGADQTLRLILRSAQSCMLR